MGTSSHADFQECMRYTGHIESFGHSGTWYTAYVQTSHLDFREIGTPDTSSISGFGEFGTLVHGVIKTLLGIGYLALLMVLRVILEIGSPRTTQATWCCGETLC